MNHIVDKLFSARFWMAIIFTLGTVGLAYYLVSRQPESSAVVWTGVTSITIVIIKDYFSRNDRGTKDMPKP